MLGEATRAAEFVGSNCRDVRVNGCDTNELVDALVVFWQPVRLEPVGEVPDRSSPDSRRPVASARPAGQDEPFGLSPDSDRLGRIVTASNVGEIGECEVTWCGCTNERRLKVIVGSGDEEEYIGGTVSK